MRMTAKDILSLLLIVLRSLYNSVPLQYECIPLPLLYCERSMSPTVNSKYLETLGIHVEGAEWTLKSDKNIQTTPQFHRVGVHYVCY